MKTSKSRLLGTWHSWTVLACSRLPITLVQRSVLLRINQTSLVSSKRFFKLIKTLVRNESSKIYSTHNMNFSNTCLTVVRLMAPKHSPSPVKNYLKS